MPTRRFERLLTRVKGEFVEMPGLTLTVEQGARLWALERDECAALLRALVQRKFLTVRPDGQYLRATEGLARDVRMRTAKASLTPAARFADTPAGRRISPPARKTS